MFTLETTATAAYVVAALLFILALAGLSRHETSRAGNIFGIIGMAIALIATIGLAFHRDIEALGVGLLIGATVIGAAIGLFILPLSAGWHTAAWVVMWVAIVATVATGIDYLVSARRMALRAAAPAG